MKKIPKFIINKLKQSFKKTGNNKKAIKGIKKLNEYINLFA